MRALSRQEKHVVCMKWGDLYGPEYVNILYAMVKRHLSEPFQFHCMTDNPDGLNVDIETHLLLDFPDPPEPYFSHCQTWRKLLLLSQKYLPVTGKVLFLDLDVVVVGDLSEVFAFTEQFGIIENWYQPGRSVGQASAMCFEAEKYGFLLETYLKDPVTICKTYRTEQAFITQHLDPDQYAFFPEEWFVSFKKHCLPGGMLNPFIQARIYPAHSKVVVFHGHPNPPDAIEGRWGIDRPWYKIWYKTIKPVDWVKAHWRL